MMFSNVVEGTEHWLARRLSYFYRENQESAPVPSLFWKLASWFSFLALDKLWSAFFCFWWMTTANLNESSTQRTTVKMSAATASNSERLRLWLTANVAVCSMKVDSEIFQQTPAHRCTCIAKQHQKKLWENRLLENISDYIVLLYCIDSAMVTCEQSQSDWGSLRTVNQWR